MYQWNSSQSDSNRRLKPQALQMWAICISSTTISSKSSFFHLKTLSKTTKWSFLGPKGLFVQFSTSIKRSLEAQIETTEIKLRKISQVKLNPRLSPRINVCSIFGRVFVNKVVNYGKTWRFFLLFRNSSFLWTCIQRSTCFKR